MLLEDSKKLEAFRRKELVGVKLKEFVERKKRLKDDMIVDWDSEPKADNSECKS